MEMPSAGFNVERLVYDRIFLLPFLPLFRHPFRLRCVLTLRCINLPIQHFLTTVSCFAQFRARSLPSKSMVHLGVLSPSLHRRRCAPI